MLDRETAIAKLNSAASEIPELLQTNAKSLKFQGWERITSLLISEIFGADSDEVSRFECLPFRTPNERVPSFEGFKNARPYRESIETAEGMLSSFVKQIQEYGLPHGTHQEPDRKSKVMTPVEKLNSLLANAPNPNQDEPFGFESTKWRNDVENAVVNFFGESSREYQKLFVIPNVQILTGTRNGDLRNRERFKESVSRIKALLASCIGRLEEGDFIPASTTLTQAITPAPSLVPQSNKVFVIHGHDDGVKETVARYLHRIGADPIILHEKPNEGLTIIEKFEKNSDVAFAVALLTPDDVGGVNSESLQPRARQNVVLELGYFMGKIGRKCTCAIVKGGIEKPSDYDGVVYTSFEDGKWQSDLVRELKAAGLDVDANKIY